MSNINFPKAYYNEEEDKLGNLVHHLKLKKGDVGGYVIMPGDPKRCYTIAKRFDNPKLIADYREFVTYTGYLNGVKVSTTSHGIGGASAAIAIEELIKVGAHTFIRVGTCGGMAMDVMGGDIVIVSGAIRADKTPDNYLPKEYPTLPNFDVLDSLIEGAKKLKVKSHIGVVHCKDAFYAQHSPETMAVSDELLYKWNAYIKSGALASEMESSTLFSVCSAKNKRAGAVMVALANQERIKKGLDEGRVSPKDESAIDCAINAIYILIKQDFNIKTSF